MKPANNKSRVKARNSFTRTHTITERYYMCNGEQRVQRIHSCDGYLNTQEDYPSISNKGALCKIANALSGLGHPETTKEFNERIRTHLDNVTHEKDCCSHIHQKETTKIDDLRKGEKHHLQQLSGIFDKNHYQQHLKCPQFHSAVRQLMRIFEAHQSGLKPNRDCLSTSSDFVVKEIARCISGCLYGSSSQNQYTDDIQSLLNDYKVVQSLPDQSHSVSLLGLYSILQDNYKDSFLCKLLDVFIAEKHNVISKIVTL